MQLLHRSNLCMHILEVANGGLQHEKSVRKTRSKLTEKYLCRSLFLKRLQIRMPGTLLKTDFSTSVFAEYLRTAASNIKY